MIKTFTENDLIRYLYGETGSLENQEIENALICDHELAEQFNGLKALSQDLDNAMVLPQDDSTKSILNYSKKLRVSTLQHKL